MTDISNLEKLRPPITGAIYNKNAEEDEDEGPRAASSNGCSPKVVKLKSKTKSKQKTAEHRKYAPF